MYCKFESRKVIDFCNSWVVIKNENLIKTKKNAVTDIIASSKKFAKKTVNVNF